MSASRSSSLTVQVPLSIRRRPGRKTVVVPEGVASSAAPTLAARSLGDPTLVKALARAFRYQRMLDEGRYCSIAEMAEAEKLDRGYMGRLLQLTLLGPDVVQATLDGRKPARLTLPLLMKPVPVSWKEQGLALG